MSAKEPKQSRKRADVGDDFSKDHLPEKIGENLRKIYQDVLDEPIPDDFLSLLQDADKKKP